MKQFFEAIKSNDLDTVNRLITGTNNVAMFVNQANNNGSTPLFIAAHLGAASCCSAVVGQFPEIKVNQADEDDCTPLHIAAHMVVQRLFSCC